jgi:response regulator RpfG family c-di-GMP phosphodiesterase
MPQTDHDNLFDNDDILFADETPEEVSAENGPPWTLMIVDDEAEIHDITRLALEDFSLDGRGLTYLSAYSGRDARRLIQDHPDIAVILLDVVMETEDSGLKTVQYIREELKNPFVRIILRTGHPGQAPERQVITEYDINDYKQKTELTAKRLFTAVTTAIRSYRDLKTIEKNRQGLRYIIDASPLLFKPRSLKSFTANVLNLLTGLLTLDGGLHSTSSGFAAVREKKEFIIFAGTGKFKDCISRQLSKVISDDVSEDFNRALDQKQSLFSDRSYTGYFPAVNGSVNIIYMESPHPLSELEKNLIQVFSNNLSVAFDNIYLNQEIVETQKEIITTLGDVVENRSKETASHALRVAEMSALLALKAGLSEEDAELLRMAAPMHDVGKIAIPDAILLKSGQLTPDEFEVIKTHTLVGYNMLKNSNRRIMKTAALIALQHHERCDGKGYPKGLKMDEIHILGRIVEITDVFDSLFHHRIYKDAWELDRIVSLFKEERGKHFDPYLVDVFLDNLEEFLNINKEYPD